MAPGGQVSMWHKMVELPLLFYNPHLGFDLGVEGIDVFAIWAAPVGLAKSAFF